MPNLWKLTSLIEFKLKYYIYSLKFGNLANFKFTNINKSTALFSHECIHEIGPINWIV